MWKTACIGFIICIACVELPGQNFTSSNLPIMVITNRTGWPLDSAWLYITVDVGVIDNKEGRNHLSDPFSYSTRSNIKIQGSSTVVFPKKSFRLELVDNSGKPRDMSIMGLPPHNDWDIKAQYQDKSLIRDDVAFSLFNQMGHYSSRSRFFELVVNGDYKGVYQLIEKIKPSKYRLNISKLTPQMTSGDELTGGYIIALDKYFVGDPGWYSKYASKDDSSNFFLYDYPHPDSMPQVQKDYIRNYFNDFEDALVSPGYTSSTTGYRRYIDVNSFIDQFIITELGRNVDGYRTSTFFTKDRVTSGNGKLQAIPIWDNNLSFGNCEYVYGNDPNGWQYTQYTFWNFVPFWWRRFLTDKTFTSQLRCRYNALRSNVLSESSIFKYIDAEAALLDESQQRNFTRWPIMGTVVPPNPSPVPTSYAGEIAYLKWWFNARLKWLDKNIPGECIISTPISNVPDSQLSVYPNPSQKELTIDYRTSGQSTYVNLQLFNMLGTPVGVIFEGSRKDGRHEEVADISSLPSGTYILKYTVNDETLYQKIIKL
jgi:hypothetical protein